MMKRVYISKKKQVIAVCAVQENPSILTLIRDRPTVLLLDNETAYLTDYTAVEYLLINLSLRMATATAMSLAPHILIHSAPVRGDFRSIAIKNFPST